MPTLRCVFGRSNRTPPKKLQAYGGYDEQGFDFKRWFQWPGATYRFSSKNLPNMIPTHVSIAHDPADQTTHCTSARSQYVGIERRACYSTRIGRHHDRRQASSA